MIDRNGDGWSSSGAPWKGGNVRILVAGDAAVGKTWLCGVICGGGAPSAQKPPVGPNDWTCGCALSVTREIVELDARNVEVDVELWEVGGTKLYSLARPIFYEGIDGVVLVYDVSNVKSYDSLVEWLLELCTAVLPPSLRYWEEDTATGASTPEDDLEGGDGRQLQQAILTGRTPVLFVAHKCDLRPQSSSGGSAGSGVAAFGPGLRRPRPPDRPLLLNRLIAGEGQGPPRTTSGRLLGGRDRLSDSDLAQRLCDFVMQGRHTAASSRPEALTFDFTMWRDFVKECSKAARDSRRRRWEEG